jgi:hypothetical protein
MGTILSYGRATAAVVLLVVLTGFASAQTRPPTVRLPPEQRQALQTLVEAGGILIHADERLPDYPVLLVDFNRHPELELSWLEALQAFPKIATVGLGGTAVSDEGALALSKLTNLEVLVLANTPITDEGGRHLSKLRKLRTLDIRGTDISAEVVAELRRALPRCEIAWEQPPERFSAAKLEEIRKRLRKVSQINDPTGLPEGWSKSTLDPNKLLAGFQGLKLRKGFILRAYQFNEEQNGESVIWALPVDAEFPEPIDCPRLPATGFQTPKPFDALDDVMEAIQGEDTSASYLAASLFRREMQSFGVLWHGMKWNTHTILSAEPAAGDFAAAENEPFPTRPLNDTAEWTWHEDRPRDWRPSVKMDPDRVTVTFYTYSPLAPEGFHRHTDIYRRGKYRARVENKQIAEGTGGIAF